MRDEEKLQSTVEPFYGQFTILGELHEDGMLPRKFLRKAHKIFGKQYGYELKLLIRAENRNLKHDFLLEKKSDKCRFRCEKRAFADIEKKKRKAERVARKRKQGRK